MDSIHVTTEPVSLKSQVENLTLFAAAKGFSKSIKNWQSYGHGYRGTFFWLTVYNLSRNVAKSLAISPRIE